MEMEVRSIVVNVSSGMPDSSALRYAINLAGTLGAELIGVAADQPMAMYAAMDGGAAAVDAYAIELAQIETQLKRAEDGFQSLVPASIPRRWRSYVANPTKSLIANARLADLIVTAPPMESTFAGHNLTSLGELVLAAGRPIIDVADGATTATLKTICIGWKDTREARRAVADALPLLRLAQDVVALTVTEGDYSEERSSLDDLLGWLKAHGVVARADVLANSDGFIDVLETNAMSRDADLLVIGGYGHSRMREWLFGGVTRSVLSANTLNRFISN
jgi:nucleotide-binding universal stress UspA family protein